MPELMRWFPFYIDRFLTSKRVRRMNAEQVGVYCLLLMEQWDNHAIGDDDADLALVARADVGVVRNVLSTCFRKTRKGWVNAELEEIRAEQLGRVQKLSRAGQIAGLKSAEARAKRSNPNASERSLNDRATKKERSSTKILEEKRLEERRRETAARAPEPPALNGKGGPHGPPPVDPEVRTPEPPTAAVVGPDLGGFLDDFPEIAQLVAGLKHDGGAKTTAAAIELRYLYADGEETLADPAVKGLPLGTRKRLIHVALLEYATQSEAFSRPHFGGFVRRIRDQETRGNGLGIVKQHAPPPPDDEPAPDPEVTKAGFALIKAAAGAVGTNPDAKKAAEVEDRVREQKAIALKLASGGKP